MFCLHSNDANTSLSDDVMPKPADGINFYTKINLKCHLVKAFPSVPLFQSQIFSPPQTTLNDKVHMHIWIPKAVKTSRPADCIMEGTALALLPSRPTAAHLNLEAIVPGFLRPQNSYP